MKLKQIHLGWHTDEWKKGYVTGTEGQPYMRCGSETNNRNNDYRKGWVAGYRKFKKQRSNRG